MNKHWFKYVVIWGGLGITLLVLPPTLSRADSTINLGWNLLETQAGTTFGGVQFQGVPLGTFNFAGVGVQPTGNTDTIVQRLALANAPATAIPVELVALQLASTVPVDFGFGVGIYFITLQSARGGPASTGTMTINFGAEGTPHGTADSFFDVFFDVRFGSLFGPITLSDSLFFTSAGVPWGHVDPNALHLTNVNFLLNGVDENRDFFPIGQFTERAPTGAQLVLNTTRTTPIIPEPSTMFLLGSGLIGLAGYGRKKFFRK